MDITITSNVDEVMDDIADLSMGFLRDAKSRVEKAVKSALKKVDRDIAAYQKAEIERVYKEAIRKFYEGYEPWLYDRTYSLFNLLVLNDGSKEGQESNEVSWGYDTGKMVSTRDNQPGGRDYLYDIVFLQGWHGGADKIDGTKSSKYGEHPNPGTPHYRVPVPFYTHWTWYPAAQHASSPKEMVEKAIEKLDEPGGKFWTEFERLANLYVNEAVMNVMV